MFNSEESMKQNKFSLLELLSVIVVILILATIISSNLKSLRNKTNKLNCSYGLKQIGNLIASYTNDNDGYFPRSAPYSFRDYNDGRSHIYSQNKERASRYAYHNWAGHLLPYFSLDLPNYNRGVNYQIYYMPSQGKMRKPPKAISNPNFGNYLLFEDMVMRGGHGPLSILICPDAFSTDDASGLKHGYEVPRIGAATKVWGMTSSYLANSYIFGQNSYVYKQTTGNSERVEDIDSRAMLLGEGADYNNQYIINLTFPAGNGRTNANSSAGTFNMNSSYIGANNILRPDIGYGFSFFHNSADEIWVSGKFKPTTMGFDTQFNSAYEPNAAASKDYAVLQYRTYILASKTYPGDNWGVFSDVLGSAGINSLGTWKYHSEDTKFGYAFGSMHILTADYSVKTEHIGSLYSKMRVYTIDGM